MKLELRGETLTLDVLHHDVNIVIIIVTLKELDDVRVVKLAEARDLISDLRCITALFDALYHDLQVIGDIVCHHDDFAVLACVQMERLTIEVVAYVKLEPALTRASFSRIDLYRDKFHL